MIRNTPCKRLIDCAQCLKATEGTLIYRSYNAGNHYPAEKCTQNLIIFLLKGELLVNSKEHPGTTLHDGQIILQSIGSKLELLALSKVEYIAYWFNELPIICEERFREIMEISEEPNVYSPLMMNSILFNLFDNLKEYLSENMPCGHYVELKAKEIIFLLLNYYSKNQLSEFFYPINTYTESFHFFVMRNYEKVKNVEDFAQIGGYSVTTFRRLFRNMYGVPVYEWILNKKREGILNDLQNSNERIGDISQRYGFDSMSHFAHFCKGSFGDTPRSLRKRLANGETFTILKESNTQEEEV